MAAKRCLWESDLQWKARSQFIETWKNHYPENRLAALSMVWENMKFLGCRYPLKTEEIVAELESKGAISVPDEALRTAKPLIENFTIYEREEGEVGDYNNPVRILNESAQKSKKMISFDDLGVNSKTGLFSCAVTIADKVIAVGEATGKKQARRNAAEKALSILRLRQPVIRKGSRSSTPCVIEDCTIYEHGEGDEGDYDNPVRILNESVKNSKKTISFDNLGVNSKTDLYSCTLTIENKVIAVGEAKGKKQAKHSIAETALSILQPPHPVVRLGSPSQQQESVPCVIENFTIYEHEEGDEGDYDNPVRILNESAQKSKKMISFDDLGVNNKTGLYSCTLTIENKVIAVGEATGKKQAKRSAAENALSILRPRHPVIRIRSLSQQHQSTPCVSKTELVAKAYQKAASISEDNIGNQMLRKMGWIGSGGIGKEGQGRAEPVIALGTDRKFGLGCNPTQGAQVKKQSVSDILLSFISGEDREIKFSSELSKEDRAVIHKISQQYGLKHRSYGKGGDRYLVVAKD